MPFPIPGEFSGDFTELGRISETPVASATEFRASRLGGDVFVDLGTSTISSKVSRNGVPISLLQIDPGILDNIIIDKPVLQVKVVRQSVAPGTPVPVGSTISVTLARPGDLPLGVITGIHQALKDRNIAQVFTDLTTGRPEVNGIVTRAIADQVTPADTIAVRAIFTAAHVEITEEPGHDLTAALETLKAIKTFGG
jgi:ribosomal 50S subunit-recycling heat shock protein